MRGWRSSASFLVVAIALSSCGGKVSKASFLEKADAACRSRDVALTGIVKPTDFRALADAAAALAKANDDEVAAVRRQSMPGGDKAKIRGVLDQLGAVSTSARAVESKARSQDVSAGTAAAETKAKAQAAQDGARAYGFTVCGTATRDAAATIADSAQPVLKKAFVDKVDAACAAVAAKLRDVPKPPSTAKEVVVPYLTSLGQLLDEAIGALSQPPPPGDEAALKNVVDGFRKQRADVQAQLDAVNRNDPAAAKTAVEAVSTDGEEASARAHAYGLTNC